MLHVAKREGKPLGRMVVDRFGYAEFSGPNVGSATYMYVWPEAGQEASSHAKSETIHFSSGETLRAVSQPKTAYLENLETRLAAIVPKC